MKQMCFQRILVREIPMNFYDDQVPWVQTMQMDMIEERMPGVFRHEFTRW